MECRQIKKQTGGEITEIELDGLKCNMAEMCRRKGICALSPYSMPDKLTAQKEVSDVDIQEPDLSQELDGCYEVLRFKNSLGFQWFRVRDFKQAVLDAEKYREKGQPKFIRRIEILELP